MLYYLNKKPLNKFNIVVTAFDTFEQNKRIGLYQNCNGTHSYVYRGPRNGIYIYSPTTGK